MCYYNLIRIRLQCASLQDYWADRMCWCEPRTDLREPLVDRIMNALVERFIYLAERSKRHAKHPEYRLEDRRIRLVVVATKQHEHRCRRRRVYRQNWTRLITQFVERFTWWRRTCIYSVINYVDKNFILRCENSLIIDFSEQLHNTQLYIVDYNDIWNAVYAQKLTVSHPPAQPSFTTRNQTEH